MFIYEPNFIPANFVVIGAGGNGSRLVPLLAQFLKTVAWVTPKIHIVDFDTVEDKNLLRQNFIKPDIGKYKAAVLAQRYGTAFDIDITAHTTKIESKNSVVVERQHEGSSYNVTWSNLASAIYILCVDTVQARKDILRTLLTDTGGARQPQGDQRSRFVIDAGNENDFGQITLFHPLYYVDEYDGVTTKNLFDESALPGGMMPFTVKLPWIPYAYDFYENMKEAPKAASCADLDQTLAINAMMATSMMGIIQNFVYRKPIHFHRLNISLQHGIQPEYFTHKYMIKHMVKTKARGTVTGHRVGNRTVVADYDTELAKLKKELEKAELKAQLEAAKKKAAEAAAKLGTPEVVPTEAKKNESAESVPASQPSSQPQSNGSGGEQQRPPNGWGSYLADAIAELPPEVTRSVLGQFSVALNDPASVVRISGL